MPEQSDAEKDADPVFGGKWATRDLFALEADVTVYWPDVRPCYDTGATPPGSTGVSP